MKQDTLTLKLFEEHAESEAPAAKTKEPKKPHVQIETITVFEYPRAVFVTKLGDHFERYDFRTERLPKSEFEVRVREMAEQILGIWVDDEKHERKKAKATGAYRTNLDPLAITDGKLYELAKKRLLESAS